MPMTSFVVPHVQDWTNGIRFFPCAIRLFSCCILVFPQQDGDACGVASWVILVLYVPLASFLIQISEVNENGCPANVGVSLTGWRRPRQVLWPWVSLGEPGPPASGHAGSCIALSQDIHCTLLANKVVLLHTTVLNYPMNMPLAQRICTEDM